MKLVLKKSRFSPSLNVDKKNSEKQINEVLIYLTMDGTGFTKHRTVQIKVSNP